MPQYILSFLCLGAAALPALLYRPLRIKRFCWLFPLYAAAGALFLQFSQTYFVCALLLALCLYFAVCRPAESGKYLGFLLCWNGGAAVLSAARWLHPAAASGLASWLLLLLLIALGLAFGAASRWLFRWTFEDSIPLSEERRTSPLPLLCIISALNLLLTLAGGRYPLGSAAAAVVLQILSLLTAALWNDMTLVLRHSQESGKAGLQVKQTIDRASRVSEVELLRRLTESNNKLLQISLAYRNNDADSLSQLLSDAQEQDSITYCAHPLLDAVLRHSAFEARKAGMHPDFQLQLGGLQGFSLTDLGVLTDLILGLMCEHHPGSPDTLRLRMQEWGDALILTAGRRDCLRAAPEETMNTVRQLVDEYGGWMEFSEKEKGICLSAVLFRPFAGE